MKFHIDYDEYDGQPDVLTPEVYRELLAAKKRRREAFAARQSAKMATNTRQASSTVQYRSWIFSSQSTR